MHRLSYLLLGAMLGGGAMFCAQNYHVVRSDDGYHAVPKVSATFDEAYVDVRGFDVEDWADHRALAVAIVKAEQDHLIQEPAVETVRGRWRDTIEKLKEIGQ